MKNLRQVWAAVNFGSEADVVAQHVAETARLLNCELGLLHVDPAWHSPDGPVTSHDRLETQRQTLCRRIEPAYITTPRGDPLRWLLDLANNAQALLVLGGGADCTSPAEITQLPRAIIRLSGRPILVRICDGTAAGHLICVLGHGVSAEVRQEAEETVERLIVPLEVLAAGESDVTLPCDCYIG